MNYNFLKTVYEKMPKKIKYLLSSFFINVMINNKVYKSNYRELDRFEKMSEKEQNDHQFSLLKKTLIYAYNNVPYYEEAFNKADFNPNEMQSFEEISKIPLLTKDLAIKAGESIYSKEPINFYETFTGGSSGRALRVLLDKDSIYKERAFINHYLAKYGYNLKKTRTLSFFGHNKDDDYYYSPLKNEIVISPFKLFDESNFHSVWKAIEKFNPDFVSGYPSAIYLFAQLMESNNVNKKFKLINFYAENYTNEIKAYIERTLQCKAVSNYGHTERAVFAQEYEKGYLFNKLYGYTEFLPTDSEGEFQIVCTGFISRKMPLIRYVTDDVAVFDEDGYTEIHGHKFSQVHLISKTGNKIFKGAFTLHLEAFEKVKQYQFVQNQPGKAYFDLVLIEPLSPAEQSSILSYLDRRCENQLDLEIRVVDKIKLTTRGKYIWAVNNISKEQVSKE